MNSANFIKGMGIGLAAGAALGWVVTQPKKGNSMFDPGKTVRTIGCAIENLGKTMS